MRAEISSTLCDQVIFVDPAAGTSPFSDAVLVEVNWLGRGFQRRGCAQSAVGAMERRVGLAGSSAFNFSGVADGCERTA